MSKRIEELRSGVEYVTQALNDIHEGAAERSLTTDEQVRFDEGIAYVESAKAEIERHQTVARALEAGNVVRAFEPINVNVRTSDDPFNMDELRWDTSRSELRSKAESAIEKVGGLDDKHRERATQVLAEAHDPSGKLPLRFLLTGSDLYRSGWQKVMAGKGWAMTPDEARAVERAQSLTDGAGGFAVPFTLDPTLLLTNDGTANPMRRICRTVMITTDSWNGVTSTGVTASWDGEAAEVGDDAMTLLQPSIPVYKAQAFVPFSIEIGGDWMNLEGDVRMAFADARDRLEGTAFINGTGTNQPTGIITELDGTSSEVTPATAEVFADDDVYATLSALPPRYRATGRTDWIAHIGTINQIRQFDTGGGSSFWADLNAGSPANLLGFPIHESSDMDNSDSINPAATADNHILVVGDFSRYVIVDRVGMNVELIPHLFATGNNRPSGQRGFYAWWRVGGESVDDNAFRVLNVATTA